MDDAVNDGDVTYTISTSSSSGDGLYDGVDVADVEVTNLDDDDPGIRVVADSLTTSEDPGDPVATFTIVLDTQPSAPVTIGLSSDNTDEGTVLPPSIEFTVDDWDVPQTVTITGVDDDVDDGISCTGS